MIVDDDIDRDEVALWERHSRLSVTFVRENKGRYETLMDIDKEHQ